MPPLHDPATSRRAARVLASCRQGTAHCVAMAEHTIETPITKLLGIRHPIILAGMNQASGPELAAAVSNAGGLGILTGLTQVRL